MTDKQIINDENLNDVSGGMVVLANADLQEFDSSRPWEVIHNNTGECLGRYATQDQACYAAGQYKSGSDYDKMLVSTDQVLNLRAHPQISK